MSIPFDRVFCATEADQDFAEDLKCYVCQDKLVEPGARRCVVGHYFCEVCEPLVEERGMKECGNCRSSLVYYLKRQRSTQEIECRMDHVVKKQLLRHVRVRCIYECNGCNEKPSRGELAEHEKKCKFETSNQLKIFKRKCADLEEENDEHRRKRDLYESGEKKEKKLKTSVENWKSECNHWYRQYHEWKVKFNELSESKN
jgi:hypothetical protein